MSLSIDNGFLGFQWNTALEINEIEERHVCIKNIVDLCNVKPCIKIQKKERKKRIPKKKENENVALVVEEL